MPGVCGEHTTVVANEGAVLTTPQIQGGFGWTLGAGGTGWRRDVLVRGVHWGLRTGRVAGAVPQGLKLDLARTTPDLFVLPCCYLSNARPLNTVDCLFAFVRCGTCKRYGQCV